MHWHQGVIRRVGAATTVAAVAASLSAPPALACKRLNCTVSTSASTTSTASATRRVWGTVVPGTPSGTPSSRSRPVALTEAQRIAQLRTQYQQDVYGVDPPPGCGQMPMLACPDPAAAPATAQEVTSTNTTTTTTQRTTVTAQEVAERARAKIRLAKPNIGSAPCAGTGCQGSVGVPVWLWTQALPSQSESDRKSVV